MPWAGAAGVTLRSKHRRVMNDRWGGGGAVNSRYWIVRLSL